MSNNAENLPLTKEEIEKEALILQEQLLPLSDPTKSIPLAVVDAEVRKRAGF